MMIHILSFCCFIEKIMKKATLVIIISVRISINMNEPIPVPANAGAAFFGFMGVSLALVLASIHLPIRFRSRLWHSQSRHRHQQHFALATQCCHEIAHSCRYGRYPRYLRDARGSHHQSKRYPSVDIVKSTDEYTQRNGYSHMASGLVCGFSCVVRLRLLRLQATQSEK